MQSGQKGNSVGRQKILRREVCEGPWGRAGLSGASTQVIFSSWMVTNKTRHRSLCSSIDTLLPVLQAYGPRVSGTKCHLLRPGWQRRGNADTGSAPVPAGTLRSCPTSKLTALVLLSGRKISQQGKVTQNEQQQRHRVLPEEV